MRCGVLLPSFGPAATRECVAGVARAADRLGFDSCWAPDHVVLPVAFTSRYPYSESGEVSARLDVPFLDSVAALLFVAGCTERVRLGTSVMPLGLRPPVQNAKAWATLDWLSGGRAILGVGVGWLMEEFDAVGMPRDHRNARADEMLALFEVLFREPQPSFRGRFYRFDPVYFEPKPVNGRIPIWVGGGGPASLRRAAHFAEAFLDMPKPVEGMRQTRERLRVACEAIGRDPAALGLGMLGLLVSFDAAVCRNAPRGAALIGPTPAQMIDALRRYADAGVSDMLLAVPMADPTGLAQAVETLERFAAEVLPHAR
ncbi:MAG: TIGR03619 family F420-dependent LLM class oxidoreductase [Candidatus Binatia bacterium]